MVRRFFTHLVLALGLLTFTGLKAQQVRFALSPNTVTASVGDTVKLDVVVTNFTNIVSLQMALDWDPALFDTIKPMVQNINIPNPGGFDYNVDPAGIMRYLWIPGGSIGTVPNGQAIFRIRLKVKAVSTNYWVRFQTADLELVQNVSGSNNFISPSLGNVGNPPGNVNTPVTVKTSTHTVAANQSVCVGVTANNFNSIEIAQWQMKWDSTVLRFDSLTKMNTTLGFNATHFGTSQAVTNGRLYFSWNTTPAKTVNDGDTLYKVCFKTIGAANTSSQVQTLTTGTEIYRSATGSSTLVSLTPQNGTVTISSGTPPPTGTLTFSGSTETANVGDTVCVRVYAKNFKDVAIMTWSMHWDSLKMSLVKARVRTTQLGTDSLILATATPINCTGGPCFSSTNNTFNYKQTLTGTLTLLMDLSSAPQTLTGDSTLAFDVCLKINAGANTTSNFTFDGIPLKIVVFDGSLIPVKIIPTFTNGIINIGSASVPAIVTSNTVTNVNCNGGSTGGVALTVSGGTGTYVYSWTGPNSFTAATKDITARTAGTYNVTITSGAAAPKVESFTITEPSAALASSKVITNVNCFGQATGVVVLTATGGTAPYTYLWSSTETSKDIGSKAAGTYNVTITDAKSCTKTETADITQPTAALGSSKVVTDVNCGQTNGTIVLTVTGGTSPYTYLWSSGETTKDLSNKGAGNYSVTITDSKTCTKIEAATITLLASTLASSKVVTNINCFGQNTGGIVLTVTGGATPYTYLWSSGETTKDISGKAAGTYNVTITDANTCSKTETADVTQPTAALGSSKVITNVNCFSQATGAVVLTATGGTTPYTYLWSSGETTKDLSNKVAGSYSVTITDAKSCTKIETAEITQPSAALSATSSITTVKCNAGNDGAIALTVLGGTGPYTYSWSGTNFTATTKDISTLKAGGYSVTITDSKSCALTLGPIQVTEPAVIVITPSVTNASCGTNTGVINISVTGGAAPLTYKWTGPNNYTSTNQNITALEVGAYNLEVTDGNNCKKTASASVSTTNPSFTVTNVASNVSCNSGTNGAINLTVTGGSGVFTFAWLGTNFSATTEDIASLKAGTYNVTVTETSTNCKVIPTAIVVTEPAAIAIATPQVVDVRCKDGNTGEVTITVSGGTSPYTYAWTGPNGFTAVNTRAIGPIKAGIYNVTVTDANGCTKTTTAEVKEPTGSALTLGTPSVTNVKCNGGSTGAIIISSTGGTPPSSYAWSGPNGFTSTQQNPSNIAAGTYKVTATDANGCTAISSDIVVTQPTSALAVTGAVNNAISACNGSIVLTPTGGTPPYTYAWTGKDVIAANKDQINLCPNESYSVTVTDANQCTTTRSFTVTGTIAPPIRLTDSTIVSQAGCPGQNNGAINITFTGGKSAFTFEWLNANGLIIAREQNPTRLGAGKYRVKISDAVNQTYVSGDIEIKESASTISIATASVKPQSCSSNDGEVRIDVTGGVIPYKYTWNTGATSKDLLGVVEGKYSVTVMDNNNCLGDKKDLTVERNLCPLTVTNTIKNVTCFGEKASITINIQNGEPGYEIKWANNNSIRINNTPRRDGTYEITDLTAGSYIFTITDSRGQSTTTSVTVAQPEEIKIAKSISKDTGNCSGSIVLAVTGGSPQYSYVWNDGVRSRDRFNLCTGQILSVTVTDSKNCFNSTSNDTIRSGVTALVLTNSVNITNAACPDDATGRLDITVEGGVRPYKYAWSNNTTSEDPTNLKPGTYIVTVSDNTTPTPQRVIGTYVIGSSSTLKIKDLVPTTSAATVTIEGGEAPYIITWCNGTTQNTSNLISSQSNLPAGACGVTITDSKGCKVSRPFDVTATCAVIVPGATLPGGFNLPCSSSKGSATVQTVTDQTLTPPYLFRWDNNESGPTALQLTAGARTVTVVGNNGKTCIANFVMRAPTDLKVVVSPNPNGKDCALSATATGGITPYKYKWSTAKGDTASIIEGQPNGSSFFVLVTDANSCNTDPGVGTVGCKSYCLQGSAVLTPNDDAKNDKFDIQKCDFTNIRLQVYNRWGQLVYLNENYTDQWEGNNQDGKSGKELAEGVYMYILTGTEPNGKITKSQGTVTIIRQ